MNGNAVWVIMLIWLHIIMMRNQNGGILDAYIVTSRQKEVTSNERQTTNNRSQK